MVFGPKYEVVNTDVTFSEVSQETLDTHRLANDRETQYLSQAFRDALSDPETLHRYLESDETVSWGLYVKQQLAGLAVIHSYEGAGLNRTLIFEDYQGQGLAKHAHLIRMHHWLTEQGESHLMSRIDAPNLRSHAAVTSRGYYHVKDVPDIMWGTCGVYRAVHPDMWQAFHEAEPSDNATEEVLDKVKASLDLAKASFVQITDHRTNAKRG